MGTNSVKISLILRRYKISLFRIFLVLLVSCCFNACKSGSPLFTSSSKKGPNIYSSKPPLTKSRSKLYVHSISKKRIKGKKRPIFSSKKKRYKSTVSGPKGSKDKGAKESSGGRKSGKGRKKQ